MRGHKPEESFAADIFKLRNFGACTNYEGRDHR